jgi:outer membrane receptor protein involved in Fe transport
MRAIKKLQLKPLFSSKGADYMLMRFTFLSRKFHWLAVLLVVYNLSVAVIVAQAAGNLKGKITDAENGEELIGVNVVLKGTYKGAASDMSGDYKISLLDKGSYDVEVTYMGYKTTLATAVIVVDGLTTTQDFKLERSYLAGEEVVIIGKKPLFEIDNTTSSTLLSVEDIQTQVVEDVTDLVGQQSGVTKSDNEIHIRGGRADENLYIIDNLSVKDPVSGEGTGVFLSADAIKTVEVITGGFNAEYGEAMSGVINIETREGVDELFASTSWKRDNLTQSFPKDNQNEDVIEFSIGGPLPKVELIPGSMSYFVNAYSRMTDTHLPHASEISPYRDWMDPLSLREDNSASGMIKISWRPKLTRKITWSYGRSMQTSQGYFTGLVEDKRYYPYNYQLNLDNYNTFSKESRQIGVNLKETLSQKSWFEMTYGYVFINQHADVDGKNWLDYDRPLDIEPTWYDTDIGTGAITIDQGDGFYEYGDTDFWHDHFSSTHSLKGQLTNKINNEHELKSGFEVENNEVQLLHITAPWLATEFSPGRTYDQYHAYNVAGAFYVQDKISYKGMNANIGLRLDFWRPGSVVEDVIDSEVLDFITPAARDLYYDETFGLFGGRWKAQLSPRLGISHPVTDNDMLFFSYGHFSQRPKYAYLYSKLQTAGQGSLNLLGNPNLNPTTTVAYEIGLKHRFNPNSVLQLTAFYKDMFNYITAFRITAVSLSYTQYYNMDYARSRGIELSWRHRFEKYWSFNWNMSYSVLTGKSSTPSENLIDNGRAEGNGVELGESYLRWDKPLETSANINFHVGKGQAFQIGSFKSPENWGFNLRIELESGSRYTPLYIEDFGTINPADDQALQRDDKPNTELAEMEKLFDLKFYKSWNNVLGGVDLKLFCEIQNVFNTQVVSTSKWINPLTGRAWEPGDPFIDSNQIYHAWSEELSKQQVKPPGTPARYKEPRQVMFGISLRI